MLIRMLNYTECSGCLIRQGTKGFMSLVILAPSLAIVMMGNGALLLFKLMHCH